MRKFLLLGMLFVFLKVSAVDNDIVRVLKYVESSNDSYAIGDGGNSLGVLQIGKAVVLDVNIYYGTHYHHYDMFDEACAIKVTILYMKMGAKRYFKKYGIHATEEVLVRNHNGGIYQGYHIETTKEYYRRYLKWKEILKKGE